MNSEMMGEYLKKMTNGDPEMMKQAEQYWKMLDDMSGSDPDAYKKFIDSNLEKGKAEATKVKEEIKKSQTFDLGETDYQFSLKLTANLEALQKPTAPEQTGVPEQDDFISKIMKESSKASPGSTLEGVSEKATVYLNFIRSSQVKGPLKADFTPAKIEDLNTWHVIPFTMSEPKMEDKPSAGGISKDCYIYYNMVLNDTLLMSALRVKALWQPLLNYILDTAHKRMMYDRNPILKKCMANADRQIKYYKFDPASTQFFKGFKAPYGLDGRLPKTIEIEPLPDVYKPKQAQLPTKPKEKQNPFDKENMDPMEMMDMFKTMDGVVGDSDDSKKFDDPFGLKGIDKENTKKKFVVEVLEETINYEELIYAQDESTDGTYVLSLKLDEVSSMKEVNLDVAADRIKVSKRSDNSLIFDYALKFKIDADTLKANWGKKSHILKITTKRI